MKNKKIIFVCTGNTCRSPMAEVILKNKIKLAGIEGVKVTSAGIMATPGAPMSENSRIALKELGYKVRAFKSKQLTEEMAKKADLIICMTDEHKLCLSGLKNVVTVKEISGVPNVPDPYGQGLSAYIKTSHVLEDACNAIISKLTE